MTRKTPSFLVSRIESGSRRARIAQERRGSDAMAPSTGLNQCSALPFLSRVVEVRLDVSQRMKVLIGMVFSRNVLCDCAQSSPEFRSERDMWFICYEFEEMNFGTTRAPS